jgi:hypothetical protein
MTDELGRELGAWLRTIDARPFDPATSLRRSMANVERTPQVSPSRLSAVLAREPIPSEPIRDPSIHLHSGRIGQDRLVHVTTRGTSRVFITATAMAVTTAVVLAGSLLLSGMVEGPTNPPIGASPVPASAAAQSPDPTAPVTSPEAATPPPAPELGVGSPTMSAERDGVLLEVWLDHTSLPVGERLHALVRVSNTGTSNVLWQTNICGTGPAETTITPARPLDTGVEWPGPAATFKRLLLDEELAPRVLWDATTIDLENVGCTAYGAIEPFEPGSSAEMTVAWDAVDRPGRPIVPGPATVTSTFETWTPRQRPAEPGDPDQELVASTTIEIVGEMGDAVPIGRYADIALADDTFRTWVETRSARPRSWDPYASYWPNDEGVSPDDPRYERATEGTVDIGMFLGNGPHGEVTVDLATLQVLGSKLDGKVKVTDEAASATTSVFEDLWQPLDPADIPFRYSCRFDLSFTTTDLVTASPTADVADALAAVIEEVGPQISSDDAEWYVVRQTDDLALALAPMGSTVDDQNLYRTDEGWRLRAGGGPCTPRATFGDTGVGRWRLDPAFPSPGPTTRTLHVLGYLACNGSERDGKARIELTDEAVLIALPMRTTRTGGSGACLGPTKMTIRLPEPLGQRTLYDASTLPLRGANENLDVDRVNSSATGG